VPRPLPAGPPFVRRRYLIVMTRPMSAAPRKYLAVVPRLMPEAPRRSRRRRRATRQMDSGTQ
jgi:hypothetical protein